ncbi:hypothetical protein Pelo_18505 [Pelomyxa schiedti]|nr:hypothetical protein Pelo_18505 [Pelomyxa schiedti]
MEVANTKSSSRNDNSRVSDSESYALVVVKNLSRSSFFATKHSRWSSDATPPSTLHTIRDPDLLRDIAIHLLLHATLALLLKRSLHPTSSCICAMSASPSRICPTTRLLWSLP